MAHITSIGAAMFSDLSIHTPAISGGAGLSSAALGALDTAAEFAALFGAEIDSVGGTPATGAFVRVKNVRTFPAMGTPANIVRVPNYGQRTSSSIQGQADAPQLEVDINFIPSEWAGGTILGGMVGDGIQRVYRFTLLQAEPTTANPEKYATDVVGAGLATVANSSYYWIGKMEAFLVTPSLTDAATAKITLSIQSNFFGAYTYN